MRKARPQKRRLPKEEEKTSDDEGEDDLPPLEQPTAAQLSSEKNAEHLNRLMDKNDRNTQSSSPEIEEIDSKAE